MSSRYELAHLTAFVAALFEVAGVPAERARVVARGFLEADLLGFSTHGLAKVPDNLRWLESGETDPLAGPEVLIDRPAFANWDGHRLPGHWAMHLAMEHALSKVADSGVFTMTLRRCQHVACLASALVPVIEAELVALMMVSSPEEAYVSPFGGSQRLFSNNPLAFTAPTASGPLLFDVSMAITAGGQVARAARNGARLPEAAIKTAAGTITDDPAELERGGSVMPIGGAGHGHKGHALTMMTEVLTQALGGYGRAQSGGDSEQNSVFLQVLDPAAFGSRDRYDLEVNHMVARVQASPGDPGGVGVRVPGIASWQRRARRMEEGVVLEPFIMDRLRSCAATLGVVVPDPIG